MGKIWVKTFTPEVSISSTSAPWVSAIPFIRQTSGWARGKIAYRKTTSTVWTPFYTVNSVLPGVPTLTVAIKPDSSGIRITVKAPTSTDMKSVRVKVGKKVSDNNSTDANYIAPAHGNDLHWSDWLIDPSETRYKDFPLSGSLTNGTTYYVTAWSEDTSRNFSTAVTASIKYEGSGVDVGIGKTVYLQSVGSNTFRRSSGIYINDNYLRTGNTYNQVGFWYYSDQIKAALTGAVKINQVKILVQRMAKTANVDTHNATIINLVAHSLAGSTPLSPMSYCLETDTAHNYTFAPGQARNLVVPEAWYPDILSGRIKGFGIVTHLSSPNTPFTGTYYGFPTTSGRLFLDWSTT